MRISYHKNLIWNSMFIHTENSTFDITFFNSSKQVALYVDRNYGNKNPRLNNIPAILDYLKPHLTEETFLKVQQFCFDNI